MGRLNWVTFKLNKNNPKTEWQPQQPVCKVCYIKLETKSYRLGFCNAWHISALTPLYVKIICPFSTITHLSKHLEQNRTTIKLLRKAATNQKQRQSMIPSNCRRYFLGPASLVPSVSETPIVWETNFRVSTGKDYLPHKWGSWLYNTLQHSLVMELQQQWTKCHWHSCHLKILFAMSTPAQKNQMSNPAQKNSTIDRWHVCVKIQLAHLFALTNLQYSFKILSFSTKLWEVVI